MYNFYLNVSEGSASFVSVEHNDKKIIDAIGLGLTAWNFQKWCERYLDEKELYEVEYRIFIRIH